MDPLAQGNVLSFAGRGVRPTVLGDFCGDEILFRDRYRVVQPLGKGGFGVTFLVEDMRLPGNPRCVIKQLCPKFRDDDALQRAEQRFEREARILAELGGHAQIPTLLNYFEQDGEFFLVQEYVRGATLSRLVKQHGPWAEPKVRQFLREILPVVHYIHGHNVIHRDIKPPNIIRCADTDRLVLLDFGAVKECFSEEDALHSAMTTHFVGTMGFAPPEQLALRSTFATDIYALGMTSVFLLTGKSPAKLGSDAYTGEIEWRNQVAISDDFCELLEQMLKLSLRERYRCADKTLKALDLLGMGREMGACMHRQQPAPSPSIVFSPSSNYQSPTARMAGSIRDWKNRHRPNPAPQQPAWGGWNLGQFRTKGELMLSHSV